MVDLSVDYYFNLYVEKLLNVGEIESNSIKHHTRVFNKFNKFEKEIFKRKISWYIKNKRRFNVFCFFIYIHSFTVSDRLLCC